MRSAPRPGQLTRIGSSDHDTIPLQQHQQLIRGKRSPLQCFCLMAARSAGLEADGDDPALGKNLDIGLILSYIWACGYSTRQRRYKLLRLKRLCRGAR